MANCVTWMPWALAAVKCPHSCTAMMDASTANASSADAGPSSSKPEPNTPTPAAAARPSSTCWFEPLREEGRNHAGLLLRWLLLDEGPTSASELLGAGVVGALLGAWRVRAVCGWGAFAVETRAMQRRSCRLDSRGCCNVWVRVANGVACCSCDCNAVPMLVVSDGCKGVNWVGGEACSRPLGNRSPLLLKCLQASSLSQGSSLPTPKPSVSLCV